MFFTKLKKLIVRLLVKLKSILKCSSSCKSSCMSHNMYIDNTIESNDINVHNKD